MRAALGTFKAFSAVCTAVHETGQRAAPFYVVGVDLPSLPGDLEKRGSQVAPTRAKLIHKGLVYAPERGRIAFTVPGVAGFVARQID